MDPITMTLVVALTTTAPTYRPKWEDQLLAEQSPKVLVLPKPETTAVPLIERRSVLVASGKAVHSLRDKLHQELMTFIPKGNEDPSIEPVSKIENVLAANEFLQKLPGSVPLPILMRNDDGEIGMYWDNDHMYIDVDIESASTVSLYIRDQTNGRHSYIEDMQISELDTSWFETNIGDMLKPDASIA